MIVRPASVLPVIVTRPVILFVTSSSPTSDPLPVTTFTTPFGQTRRSIRSWRLLHLSLPSPRTTVFPAQRSGSSQAAPCLSVSAAQSGGGRRRAGPVQGLPIWAEPPPPPQARTLSVPDSPS